MSQQVQLTLETGDKDFLLSSLMDKIQSFLDNEDFEITSCFKIRKTQKRSKDV